MCTGSIVDHSRWRRGGVRVPSVPVRNVVGSAHVDVNELLGLGAVRAVRLVGLHNAHEVIPHGRESAINLVAGGSGSLCCSKLVRADDLNVVRVAGAAGERHGLDDAEYARRDHQVGVSTAAADTRVEVAAGVPVILAVARPLAGGFGGGGGPVWVADRDVAVAD